MKRSLALLCVVAPASMAQAQLIAYWSFPSTVPASGDNFKITWPLAADQGTGSLDVTGRKWDGTPSGATALQQGNYQYFTGSPINVQAGVVAGSGLSLRGGPSAGNTESNGTSFDFTISTIGLGGLHMSFADRATSTGPDQISFSYSTDGLTFNPLAFANYINPRNSNFALRAIDFSSEAGMLNQASLVVRMTVNGYTGNSGTFRIDNVQFNVPTPGAMALLGAAGLLAARRRR